MKTSWMFLAANLLSLGVAHADDWPQWRGPTHDGVWHETGIIEKFSSSEVPIRWRAAIGPGYSGPTVAAGRVFLTDRVVEPQQQERVLCFDEQTGKPLWSYKYDCQYRVGYPAGPRASVAIDEGRAYALGTMGHLHCLDAADGTVHWEHDLNDEYDIRMPQWGIAASPLVEGDLVIIQVGGDGACLVAFDKKTGKERWRALNDHASYAAPIMIEQGGKRVLVCMTGENVVGLDPQTGKVYWLEPFHPQKMPIGISTPIVDAGRLFLTTFYDGSLMLKLSDKEPKVEQLWKRRGFDERRTDALHSIISTPIFVDGLLYGCDSYGELRCLDPATGDRLWEDTTATPTARWSTIHFVRNGDREWLFNEKGELIIARLAKDGYHEVSRAKLINPTTEQLRQRGGVCWSHPAFAGRCVFARNDEELVCGDLAASR